METKELLKEEQIRTPEEEIDVRLLLAKYRAVMEENRGLKEENTDLKEQLANCKKLIYGQKSEKTEVILEGGEQMSFFDEAEENADRKTHEAEKDVIVPAHKRKQRRTHEEAFENLPVEEVLHTVEEKTCPECGEEMKPVGKEFVRDELVHVPARLFVRKHYVEVVKCSECGEDESKDELYDDVPAPVFKKAVAPAPMIPHSFCSPELLAHILYEKYIMAVPLERQSKDFKAKGLTLSTATLSNWVIYAAENFMRPIYNRMKTELLSCSVIHADETVVQVLHEPNRKAKTDSRMWVYCAGKYEGHSNILFEYSPTRNGANAQKFLEGYRGYLVCDGYDGYNKLPDVTRCGCFAHARRKFAEALPTDKALLASSAAARGLEMCNDIFRIERELDETHANAEVRYKQRQERSKPILDGLFTWLGEQVPVGGSKLAKAIQYCLNEKAYLYRFLENGSIPVDNNRAENAIRPFVVGRKNWLFSTSQKGATASAAIYSLAATATANGLNVEEYFTRICRGMQEMPWKTN